MLTVFTAFGSIAVHPGLRQSQSPDLLRIPFLNNHCSKSATNVAFSSLIRAHSRSYCWYSSSGIVRVLDEHRRWPFTATTWAARLAGTQQDVGRGHGDPVAGKLWL
jgi:hypothetical protein